METNQQTGKKKHRRARGSGAIWRSEACGGSNTSVPTACAMRKAV